MAPERNEATSKKLRKFVRVKPEEGSPVRVDLNGEGLIDVFNVNDISQSGISIDAPYIIEDCRKDLEVSLIISLPEPINSSVNIQGIIKHIDNKQLGIMFANLPEADREKIRDYVHFRLRPTTSGFFGRILDWFDVPT